MNKTYQVEEIIVTPELLQSLAEREMELTLVVKPNPEVEAILGLQILDAQIGMTDRVISRLTDRIHCCPNCKYHFATVSELRIRHACRGGTSTGVAPTGE